MPLINPNCAAQGEEVYALNAAVNKITTVATGIRFIVKPSTIQLGCFRLEDVSKQLSGTSENIDRSLRIPR